MMLQTLRKAGGSLVMTVPKAFIDQNGLGDGSQVELHLLGKKMTVGADSPALQAGRPNGRNAARAAACRRLG